MCGECVKEGSHLIRKAFGHAADPCKGPCSVEFGIDRKKIQEVGRVLPQFSSKTGNAKEIIKSPQALGKVVDPNGSHEP